MATPSSPLPVDMGFFFQEMEATCGQLPSSSSPIVPFSGDACLLFFSSYMVSVNVFSRNSEWPSLLSVPFFCFLFLPSSRLAEAGEHFFKGAILFLSSIP